MLIGFLVLDYLHLVRCMSFPFELYLLDTHIPFRWALGLLRCIEFF